MRDVTANNSILTIKNLRTYFYAQAKQAFIRAVDGVDLEVTRGQTLGIVGESGSGKSVTMLSAMGLINTTPGVISGKITFNNSQSHNLLDGLERYVALQETDGRIMSVHKNNHRWLSKVEKNMQRHRGKHISMIFQNPKSALNPYETIGAQITEMILLHNNHIKTKAEAKEHALHWLERVKIDSPATRYDSYPYGLSGGMCQRVMVAMALSSEPELLIADEPTTGLDATIQAKIIELLAELKSELGTTSVLISHDINTISALSDTVAVMYGGRVIEVGTNRRVLKNSENSNHPYTTGLLASTAHLSNLDQHGHLPAIKGEVSDNINLPKGCRFYDRCEHKTERIEDACASREPDLFEIESGHCVRCWLHNPVD